MFIALFCILFVILFIIAIGYFLSAPKYSGPISDHFNGKKFFNPNGATAKGLSDVFKWLLNRKKGKWTEVGDFSFGEKPATKSESGLVITFVNHSTFLIQANSLNILTDPIWSKRAGPLSWLGSGRRRPPGIRFEDLPPIDIVLLSHNHYDHLDLPTLKMLHKKFKPTIFTSLGIKSFLEKKGIDKSIEMDWWDEMELNESVKLVSVPAQHFSGRGMFDRDATLWAGFVIRRSEGNIYFAADTGYHGNLFKEIGKKISLVHVAILPIGAYKPRWFMSPIHTSPGETVKIHLDVMAKKTIACHFGTFLLADEGEEEMYDELYDSLLKNQVDRKDFIVIKEGSSIRL